MIYVLPSSFVPGGLQALWIPAKPDGRSHTIVKVVQSYIKADSGNHVWGIGVLEGDRIWVFLKKDLSKDDVSKLWEKLEKVDPESLKAMNFTVEASPAPSKTFWS